MFYSSTQYRFLLLIMALFITQGINASEEVIDNASLWLPKAYESDYPALKKAAVIIKSTEKCNRLLSGKLLEGRSTPDHLHFSFRCRTAQRYSFSVEFDNNTQQIIDPYEESKRREEALQEQERLENEPLIKQKEKEMCHKAMTARIEEFKEPTIIKDSLTEVTALDDMATYRLFFDSLGSKRNVLFYKIDCNVVSGNDYQLRVSPREKAMVNKDSR